MKLTGHRSESVYRRYAIVSPGDLQEAARKLAGPAATAQRDPVHDPVLGVAGKIRRVTH